MSAIKDVLKIALVLCPGWGRPCPPYSIAQLTGILRANNFIVTPYDLNNFLYHNVNQPDRKYWNTENFSFWYQDNSIEFFFAQYAKQLELLTRELTKYKIIGFSITALNKRFSLELAKRIKTLNPRTTIIVGGPEATPYNNQQELIENKFIDAVFSQEADESLPLAIKHFKRYGHFKKIPGIIFKSNSSIIDGGPPLPIKNLDAIPFPDYSDFNTKDYDNPIRIDMMSSRGCINKCNHCPMTVQYKRFISRSPENIVKEIRHLIETIPKLKFINFNDCLLNASIRTLETLCQLIIQNRLSITWEAHIVIRKDLTLDLFRLMRKAGCTRVVYGIESGSEKVLRLMNRKFYDPALASKMLKLAHKAKIETLANIMFGYPGETEKDFSKTLAFLKKNRKWISMVSPQQSLTSVLKDTYLYNHLDEFNIEENPHHMYWKTKDNTNTYPIRFERYRKFWQVCSKYNIPTSYAFCCNESQLGDYYYNYAKNYSQAVTCYKHDLINKAGTTQTLKRFIESCKKTNQLTAENKELIKQCLPKKTKIKYKVSIIIATKDRGPAIIETLHALTKLDFKKQDYEIIIIDTQPSPEHEKNIKSFILKHTNISFKYISESRLGLSHGRNIGIKNSQGKFIAFIDDDAIAPAYWLKNLLAVFKNRPWVYAVGGKVLSVFSSTRPIWLDERLNRYISNFDKGNELINLTYNEYPRGANMIFRRETFEEVGLFLDCLGLKGKNKMAYEEIELCYRLETAGKYIMYTPYAEVAHLIRSERLAPAWFKQRFYWQGRSEAVFRLLHLHHNSGIKLIIRNILQACREKDPYQKQYHLGYTITLLINIFNKKEYTTSCK